MKKKIIVISILILLAFVFFIFQANMNDKQFSKKLKKDEEIQYLVIGDSIGESVGASSVSSSWTSLLNEKINKTFKNEPTDILLTKGGSDVFDGLVEFSSYQTSKDFDFVFVCFGQNDQTSLTIQQYEKTYKTLIEEIKKRFPNAEIIPIIENSLETKEFSDFIFNIAKDYGLITFDARESFINQDIPVKNLTKDGIHPNDKGYEIYAENIFNIVSNLINNKEKKQMSQVDEDVELIEFEKNLIPAQNTGFEKKDHYFVSEAKGSYLEYTVKTSEYLGLSLISNKDGGYFNVYVDGQKVAKFSSYSPYKKNRYFLIDDGVKPGVHKVKIIIEGSNKNKQQRIIRIKGIVTQ